MLIDMKDFSAEFLKGINLQNVICHMCNQCTGILSDPVTETLVVMATTPLAVVVTEAGVAMFRNKPTMVFPYTSMTPRQLLYIKGIVDLLVENSSTSTLKLRGSVQMGGGCIVVIPSPRTQHDFIINTQDILHSFISAVAMSEKYTSWTKKALCGIITQRLSCSVNLTRETMMYSASYSESLFSST